MRFDELGVVHLEKGERVPCSCVNCGYIWQPDWDATDEEAIVCPLCQAQQSITDMPVWEKR